MRIFLTLISLLVFLSSGFAMSEHKRIIKVSAGQDVALGVAITDPCDETLEKLKLKGGAEIIDVLHDTEAEKIGLKEDDIIVKFDGQAITSAEQLNDLVEGMEKPKSVKMEVQRNGKSKSFNANLKKVEESDRKKISVDIDEHDFDFDFDLKELHELPNKLKFMKSFGHDQKGGFLGVEAKDISEQMLEYFDVKHGVLVEGVIDETPAQKAGIKAGDVITKINDREIKDYSDLIRTLNFYNPGEKVTLNYVRKGKKKSEKLELAEKKGFAAPRMLHKAIEMDGGPHKVIWHSEDGEDMEILHEKAERFEKKREALEGKAKKMIKRIKMKIFII